MKRPLVMVLALSTAWLVPMLARANHVPHDDREPNPNCAFDAKRSADWDGDGEPDHFIVGLSNSTSFPHQVWVLTGQPGAPAPLPSWLGANDNPDKVSVVSQGDHRWLGANPQEEPGNEPNPEQLHNGAVTAQLDYDGVESGAEPKAFAGAGIYEADMLFMACAGTDHEPTVAVCPGNGIPVEYRTDNVEACPTG
jgi:hypothetical protein